MLRRITEHSDDPGQCDGETRAFLDPRGPKLRGLSWDNIANRVAAEVKIDLRPDHVIAQYRMHRPDWARAGLLRRHHRRAQLARSGDRGRCEGGG
jgi:hypothetical protein